VGVKILFDPFKIVIEAFEKLHPDKTADVVFGEGMYEKVGAYGETFMPDAGGPPVITIDTITPIDGAVEVLAHELAHVAAGIDAGHGEAWEAEFEAINQEYTRIADAWQNTHRQEK